MWRKRLKRKCPKTFFSDNYIRNIFAKKILWLFFRLFHVQVLLIIRPHAGNILFIVIFYTKTSMQYALIIWLFFEICWYFFFAFFSKRGFKRSLNIRKPLKSMLLNEKNKAVLKTKDMKISLYTRDICHVGQEVMFTNRHTLAS